MTTHRNGRVEQRMRGSAGIIAGSRRNGAVALALIK